MPKRCEFQARARALSNESSAVTLVNRNGQIRASEEAQRERMHSVNRIQSSCEHGARAPKRYRDGLCCNSYPFHPMLAYISVRDLRRFLSFPSSIAFQSRSIPCTLCFIAYLICRPKEHWGSQWLDDFLLVTCDLQTKQAVLS